MLRVGLTGELGSGKSTVAAMLSERGAQVFSSDEMGRAMMQPGQAVYGEIVARFGSGVLAADSTLDRRRLAQLAFAGNRTEELNSIVHPAVIEEQARQLAVLAEQSPHAIAVVESALIFSTRHGLDGQPWRERFDAILLVTAPEDQQIARFLARVEKSAPASLTAAERTAVEQDARQRLAVQHAGNAAALRDPQLKPLMIRNDAGIDQLESQVAATWESLRELERAIV